MLLQAARHELAKSESTYPCTVSRSSWLWASMMPSLRCLEGCREQPASSAVRSLRMAAHCKQLSLLSTNVPTHTITRTKPTRRMLQAFNKGVGIVMDVLKNLYRKLYVAMVWYTTCIEPAWQCHISGRYDTSCWCRVTRPVPPNKFTSPHPIALSMQCYSCHGRQRCVC
jgi:hypothetical protein